MGKELGDVADSLMGKEKFFQEEHEWSQVIDRFNEDKVSKETNMSSIDFNARLNKEEINACLVFDTLRGMGILPEDIQLTRQLKRLSVSQDGKGRAEIVDILKGEREKQNEGVGGWMKKKFGFGGQ